MPLPKSASSDHNVLLKIQKLLDAKEWDADTLDAIAHIMRDAGFRIREPMED